MKALLHILVSKFIFIWTTKNLHNRFWMNAKGFSHSGIIRAESRTYFAFRYIFLSACHTTRPICISWCAVSCQFILYECFNSNDSSPFKCFTTCNRVFWNYLRTYSVWHVDLKLIQIFIFVAIFIVFGGMYNVDHESRYVRNETYTT